MATENANTRDNVSGNGPSAANVPVVLTDKKAVAAWKQNHELHVLLVMRQNGLTKAQALVQVYHEGIEGLNKRL